MMGWPEKIFVDASVLVALYNENDGKHNRAVELFSGKTQKSDVFVTTDLVINETYTGLLYMAGYKSAILFDKEVFDGRWDIVWVDKEKFIKARQVFVKFNNDKNWSYVDCTSYVVMKKLKIRKVFSFDHDFEQMGFEPL